MTLVEISEERQLTGAYSNFWMAPYKILPEMILENPQMPFASYVPVNCVGETMS
jgi:hypothetical protein